MSNSYLVQCPHCGRRHNSNSSYCDICNSPIEEICVDGYWYNCDELDEDNCYYDYCGDDYAED